MKKVILLSMLAAAMATASFAGNGKGNTSAASEKVQVVVNGKTLAYTGHEALAIKAKPGHYQMRVTVYKNGRAMYSYTEKVEVKKGAKKLVRVEAKKVKNQEVFANRPILVNHQKLYLKQHFS
jgi:hypothetical protein